MSCGRCGCAITAEIKKGRYIYYRCTGCKGKCGEATLREEKLQGLLGELVRAIEIDEDKVEWIKEAPRASHQDERAYSLYLQQTPHEQRRLLNVLL